MGKSGNYLEYYTLMMKRKSSIARNGSCDAVTPIADGRFENLETDAVIHYVPEVITFSEVTPTIVGFTTKLIAS